MNSFTDFIDVTRHLVAEGYAAKDKVFAMGGSAGGLLVAAVANLSPERLPRHRRAGSLRRCGHHHAGRQHPAHHQRIRRVGQPERAREYYDYMLSYSPYDNVRPQRYPAMFVTTGLWDSQVQYYEPAKWVAKLRALKTDANPLLLHVDMEAGHGGKSGRFQRYREIAMEYAFLLARRELAHRIESKKKRRERGKLNRGAKIDPRERNTRTSMPAEATPSLRSRRPLGWPDPRSAAPWRNQLAATRVAEATRASIPSSANWPSPRRTSKVGPAAALGTNNAMICDCIRRSPRRTRSKRRARTKSMQFSLLR